MENDTTVQQPTPPFVPTVGREVLYALQDVQAVVVNVKHQHLFEVAQAHGFPTSQMRPIEVKAGDRLAAKITYVHPDGLCELSVFTPSGDLLPTCAFNSYENGGYLYFNQIPEERYVEPDPTNKPKEEQNPF